MGTMRIKDQWATLPLAQEKRHFVFGDIHGRFSTFVNLLDSINYDPAGDVLYSVGDLIDRGPDSVSVVKFFQQENCYAVRGNHEQFLVNPDEWYAVWMYPPNGGPATLQSLEDHGMSATWLKQYCDGTPIILDVGANDNEHAFRLVHAENPFDWTEQMLRDFVGSMSGVELGESRLLWGREDIGKLLNNTKHMRPAGFNIEAQAMRSQRNTFCGHTPTTDVIRCHNTSWIDTYRGKKLTCVNAITNEAHSVPMIVGE